MKALISALVKPVVLSGFLMFCMPSTGGPTTSTLDFFDFAATHIGLTGYVYLPNGQAASSAIVELRNGVDAETSTSVQADGSFELPYPSFMMGHYTVHFRHPGFATATFEMPFGHTVPAIMPPLTLRPAEVIQGRLNAIDHTPLKGIHVKISTVFGRHDSSGKYQKVDYQAERPYSKYEFATTDDDGRFRFNDLTRGFYALQAYGPGLVTHIQEIETPIATDLNITMTSATGTVSGQAIRFGSNEPLPGTTVTISLSSMPAHGPKISKYQSTLSDYDGNFQFSGVEPGYYGITGRNGKLVQVIDSCPVNMIKDSTGQVAVILYPGHRIFGQVRDAITSEPLAGVEISALSYNNEDTTTTTDFEGRYSLEHVLAGGGNSLFLSTKKRGYAVSRPGGDDGRIPKVLLSMDELDVQLDLPIYLKGPGDYDGFID